MKFLDIFKGKPLKRIEAKVHSDDSKIRIRASRTSGINASAKLSGNVTYNTKHGLRASKTFNGLTIGVQNGTSILKGRWSTQNKLINLNLAKSGLSVSITSKFGTLNLKNPNRSSFKFGGIQIRGKKAAGPATIFALMTLLYVVVKWVLHFTYAHIKLLVFITRYILVLSYNFIFLLYVFLEDAFVLFNEKKTRNQDDL
tara:strand:+ start:23 stop:619 length:597 start_codon:yes stop_codon:yes gene_type:complete